MPTTSNFGWTTPADTDLVKDGASAIRTLGNGIDTSFLDLKGGTTGQVLSKASNTDLDFTWVAQDDSNAIQNAIVDAKGDLIAASAADTPARIAVGTDGQYLQADSTTATGLKWATVSSGGMTLIASASPTGVSTYTFSSIPSTYKHLLLLVQDISSSAGTVSLSCRLNGDTANYSRGRISVTGTTASGQANDDGQSAMFLGQISGRNTSQWQRFKSAFWVYDYANTATFKSITGTSSGYDGTSSQFATFFGTLSSTSAVSSLTILDLNGPYNFSNGTLKLYGVS